MGQPVENPGLNLRIDMNKVDAALQAQPRLVVSAANAAGEDTTLLEISRVQSKFNPAALDNQVNVLC